MQNIETFSQSRPSSPLVLSELLERVSTHLLGTLNFKKSFELLSNELIQEFAVCCTIDVLDSDHIPIRMWARHRDITRETEMEWILKFDVREVSDRYIYASRLNSETFVELKASPQHESLLIELEIESLIHAPLLHEGKLLGAFTLYRDHTMPAFEESDLHALAKIAEKASLMLIHSKLFERAQTAVSARNDFVATVSHDLKNPLCAILLSTAFIRRNFDQKSELSHEESLLKKQVDGIHRAAQSMNSLISDFLDLSRIEAGRLKVDLKVYCVDTLLKDLIEMMSPIATEKEITLTWSIESTIKSAGFDRERIFQVLSNLVGNAIKFTPRHGKIKIDVLQLNNCELCFSVRDSGPGIPGHQRPHIFDRYWQAQDNYRAGSGLGLSIAKGIVEAHHGRIWVDSTLEQGSTFFFTLPKGMNAN